MPPRDRRRRRAGCSATRRAPRIPSTARLGVAIPVNLGSGMRLIVGRDIEDQRRFADEMGTLYFLGLGFLSLTGLVAGFLISRFALSRIEAINVRPARSWTATCRGVYPSRGGRRVRRARHGFQRHARSHRSADERPARGLRQHRPRSQDPSDTPAQLGGGGADGPGRGSLSRRARAHDRKCRRADQDLQRLLLVARLEAGVLEENAERFDVGRSCATWPSSTTRSRTSAGLRSPSTWRTVSDIAATASSYARPSPISSTTRSSTRLSPPTAPGRERSPSIAIGLRARGERSRSPWRIRAPALPPQDRERVLKRFVRLEKSRTQPGTGLGLSLVQAVARLHGGGVRLEDNSPGLRVVLDASKAVMTEVERRGSASGWRAQDGRGS